MKHSSWIPVGLVLAFALSAGSLRAAQVDVSLTGTEMSSDTCFATGSFGDGAPTVADLVFVIRVLAGTVPPPDNLYRLDVNGDCVIDSADARLIVEFFENGISVFPQYPVPTCCSPTFDVQCPIEVAGDLNNSGTVTAADVIALVNFIFRGNTDAVSCPVAGDFDCSGAATSADIINWVNFLFKSGEPPCDLCAVMPEVWLSCPYPAP